MGVAFRAQTGVGAASTSSLTVTIPSGCETNDVAYVLMVVSSSGATITPPSGWTDLNSGDEFPYIALYRKVLTSGDPGATATFELGETAFAEIGLIAFSGADTTTPEDATAYNFALGFNSSTITCPSVTTTEADDMLLIFCGIGGDTTVTGPAGWAEGPVESYMGVFYDTQATAGASGTKAITQPGTLYWGSGTIAIKPASGGGGGSTTAGDTISVSSSVATGPNSWLTSAADTVSVSSSAGGGSTHVAAASDTISISSSTTTEGAFHTTAGDTVSVSSSAAASGARNYTAAAGDTVTFSSSADVLRGLHTTAGDTVSVTSSGAGGSTRRYTATAADTISFSSHATASGSAGVVIPRPELPTSLTLDAHTSGLDLDEQTTGLVLNPHTIGLTLNTHASNVALDAHDTGLTLDE